MKPVESRTILLANLYQNPKVFKDGGEEMSDKQVDEHFNHFFADMFKRVAAEGQVDLVVVCENENHHLSGNVYVKYTTCKTASCAAANLNREWYAGRPVYCELSPVSNFNDANCRAHDTNSCTRGDHCNFMHMKHPKSDLRRLLFKAQDKQIALAKLRLATGNPEWGKRWEAATEEKYVRENDTSNTPESLASVESQSSAEPNGPDPVDGELETSTSKVDAVAKLFR